MATSYQAGVITVAFAFVVAFAFLSVIPAREYAAALASLLLTLYLFFFKTAQKSHVKPPNHPSPTFHCR